MDNKNFYDFELSDPVDPVELKEKHYSKENQFKLNKNQYYLQRHPSYLIGLVPELCHRIPHPYQELIWTVYFQKCKEIPRV